MKQEIRVVGFDDAPFDKFKDKKALVIGVVYRGGNFMDGVLSTEVEVDGKDSTDKLIALVRSSKFYRSIQAIFLDGIAFGGFNIIDVTKLRRTLKLPIITIIRKMPDFDKIEETLNKLGYEDKVKLLKKATKVRKVKGIFCQYTGCKKAFVEKILEIACPNAKIPECLRVAHLIGSGVVRGESKGRP